MRRSVGSVGNVGRGARIWLDAGWMLTRFIKVMSGRSRRLETDVSRCGLGRCSVEGTSKRSGASCGLYF